MTRLFALSLLAGTLGLAVACGGDDDSDGAGNDGTGDGGATSGDAGTATDGGGDDGTATGGDDGGTATDGGGTGTGGSGDTSDEGLVVLQNDDWPPGGGGTVQAWPGPGDCIAAVYGIDASYYPFSIEAIRVLIGGGSDTQPYDIAIWDVDDQNLPTSEIAGAEVQLSGNAGMHEIDLDAEGITVPTITDGTFAAVACHVDHRGEPSFVADADGTVSAEGNFVYQVATDEWVPSPDFFMGVDGDFILRAVIRPGM